MKQWISLPAIAAFLLLALPGAVRAQQARLVVHLDQPGFRVSPTFYGLMTEEINHSYDGGLYAELIQNRIFQNDPTQPVHWSVVTGAGSAGSIAIDTDDPVNTGALDRSLRLDIAKVSPGGRVGVANDGYWGIPVASHTIYHASFYARCSPGFAGPLTVDIESADGVTIYAKGVVTGLGTNWRRYEVTLTTGACRPSEDNRFVISASHPGSVWLSLVSLFPPTYHNRPNGNRPDIMRLLAGTHPSFLRLPGGNYVEGNTIAERFDWTKTIGPLSQRPGHQSPWGYRSDDGLGLLEYLEWCEDLHMQPVLAVYAGYSLDGEHVAPGPQLAPYVQSALDEIEYVTGSIHTRWGAERARDGHPQPFPLHYIEIGNEDFFDRSGSYDGRFAQFYDAIKAKYPILQIIATTPVKSRRPDMLDEHYYLSPAQMERGADRYDSYSRKGPKIFVGEWASYGTVAPWAESAYADGPTSTFGSALGDAAWMTGMERNSDLVVMESYAPLLVNVNPGARQWAINLIGNDALKSFASPSYYVQKVFAENTGDTEVPVTLTQPGDRTTLPPPAGRIGVGTWDTQAEFSDISVTSAGKTLYQTDFSTGDAGWDIGPGSWQAAGGALRQTSGQRPSLAEAGSATWTDYTYHLRAKKLSGREGFLILFHDRDAADFVQWNIGGWGNTRTRLQRTDGGDQVEFGPNIPMSIETGRWYDIAIELRGRDIRCYLDGKLVEEATDTPPGPPVPLYAAASFDRPDHVLDLKVVNISAVTQRIAIDLAGAASVGHAGSVVLLAGCPNDRNSLADPIKVAPVTHEVTGLGSRFAYSFPARSVTVLRIAVGSRSAHRKD